MARHSLPIEAPAERAAAHALNALISVADRDGPASAGRAPAKLPLAGLDLVVKDNIDVAGFPTTAGTPALAGHRPRQDAAAVRLLKQAGAVVVAKANLHELALGGTSINPTFGTVINPYSPDHTAGGSSGGSAAAVAVGMVDVALGTDTAGSSRMPASCCGVVGFRPSLGRYPADGVVPISLNRDTVGLLARRVEHVIKIDRVLAPPERPTLASSRPPRLAIPSALAQAGVSAPIRSVFEKAVRRLQAAGIQLHWFSPPIDPEALWATHAANIEFDMPRHLETYLLKSGSGIRLPDLIDQVADPIVRSRLQHMVSLDGAFALGQQQTALGSMYRLRRFADDYLALHDCDALFYPAVVIAAPRIGEESAVAMGNDRAPPSKRLMRNTLLASLAGLPSLCLPMGVAEDGLPVGALLEGRFGADAELLDLGLGLEAILEEEGRQG